MQPVRWIGRLSCAALIILALFSLSPSRGEDRVTLYFFWGEGCPHCARAASFLKELQSRHPPLEVRSLEVFRNRKNLELLQEMSRRYGVEARGVPMFFLDGHPFSGFSEETRKALETEVERSLATLPPSLPPLSPDRNRVEVPFFGTVDATRLSLPVFTIVIAGLDSFNPCAFFVLLFLLSLLVHAHSRKRMIIIGGIFVLSSALVYFLFMAAWLNFFLLFGHLKAITIAAGVVALAIGVINIKDFFFFRKGITLAIPEQAKPKLFARMRGLVSVGSLPGMIVATVTLALAANSYEAICTAGFPMLFTRTLTLQQLPFTTYLLYLLFYNAVYVIPLAAIVAVFVVTLGSRKLSEWHGRILKLLSGVMILGLGIIFLAQPALLDNVFVSAALLLAAVGITGGIVFIARRLGMEKHHEQEHDSAR